jgi:hypothetical protein
MTLGVIAVLSSSVQAADTCDRKCLQSFVDRYLDALVAHDPARAPFAPDARIVENGQDLGFNAGLWKTASANSTYRLYFADPAQGRVGFIGLIQEHGAPAILSLDLKVERGAIVAAETIVNRVQPNSLSRPEGFAQPPKPILLEKLAPAERVSREEMIRIANSYFSGLDEEDSAENVPFDPDCQRRENGVETANSTDPKAGAMQKLGCQAQFETGFSVIVTDIRERRFPIVDEERGLVYSLGFFDHAGNVESYKRPDGAVVPVNATFRRPFSFIIGELFKIRGGRIRQIEAVLQEVPYRMPSAAALPACQRECLLDTVDRYLSAIARRDPEQAPFAANARFTENAQVLKLGDGLWRTASEGPQGYKLVVADPVTGQSGFYVLMKESGNPIWLSGRLKVAGREITELETVIIRKGRGFGEFDRAAPLPVWNETLTPAQRRPRAEMIEIADKYFEALEKNLADHVPFDDTCNRIENGVQTTNNPSSNFGGDNGPKVGALGCRENINSMMWRYITQISPRRFLIADEERGIVFGVFMFHHDGTQASTVIPGFGEYQYSAATRRPFTTVIPEMFKIRDGRIVQIEATMASLPYGSPSRWDD